MRGPDYDNISGHQWRGVQAHDGPDGVDILVVIELEIDDALVPEAFDQMPGFGIQRDHAITRSDEDDALIRAIAARPVRYASACALAGRELTALTLIHLVHPKHLTGASIERDHGSGAACGGVN